MTISTTTTENSYVGDGSTAVFAFTFPAYDESWVQLWLSGSLQGYGYSVTLNPDQEASPGGTVVVSPTPAVAQAVTIRRRTAMTQDTVLPPYGPFPAKTVEHTFDRLAMQIQDAEARGQVDVDAVAAQLTYDKSNFPTKTYVDAAIAAAIAAPAVPDSTTMDLVAKRMTHQPIEVPGALQVMACCLFTVLRNRARLDDLSWEFIRPSNYAAAFLGDYIHMLGAFPGYFDAAKCREIADHWALSYTGGGSPDVARSQDFGGTWGYSVGGRDLSNPVNWALTIAFAIERGDTTIWAAHGATVLNCLDNLPRDANGLISGSPAAVGSGCVGFPFHDPFDLMAGGSAISAYAAYAYQRLAVLADPSLMTQANALIAGLRVLRRSDGYYGFATNFDSPDTIATSLVAAYGLATEGECVKSGNALANDFLAGNLAQRGGIRFMPKPYEWSAILKTPGSLLPGQGQNGGYWHNVFMWWVVQAMQTAGRDQEAKSLMSDCVDFHIKGMSGIASTDWSLPIESFNTELGAGVMAYNQYPSGGGFCAGLAVPPGEAEDIIIDLPSGASATKTVPIKMHSIYGVEVYTPTAAAAVIALYVNGKYPVSGWTEGDSDRSGWLTEREMIRVMLYSETFRRQGFGIKPAYPWDGQVRALVTSGTPAAPVTVRLKQKLDRTPRLTLPPQTWTDAFGGSAVDPRYIARNPLNAAAWWSISAGALRVARVNRDEHLLAPMIFEDGTISANCMSIWTGHNVGLVLRYKDRSNWIWAFLAVGSGQTFVYQCLNGVVTTLGNVASGATANVPIAVSMSVVGTNVSLVSGGVSGGPWTTGVTGKGFGGVYCDSTIPNSTNVGTVDDLVITPQPTAQRDWITDDETIYARTGTWSKSGATMLTTDTLAFKCAIHPDFTGIQQMGVKATFNSANWAVQNAGLGVRAASSTNMVYAVLDGTTVKVYDRNGTDTLLGSFTLGTALTNGVDATMELRILNSYAICVKVNGEYFYPTPGGRAVNGSPCMVAKTASASSAQVTFSSMRIESYVANHLQSLPVGYVLTAGPKRWQSWNTDMVYAGHLGALVELRDHRGQLVASAVDGDDVSVVY